jgi:hypothetical protein
MPTEMYILFALVLIGAAYAFMRILFAMRYHGEMIITCPETSKPAAVKVNLARAAVASVTGRMLVELSDCSRWPERADCDQKCVVQLERDPKNHRVWNIASHWFENQKCAYCGKAIEPFHHYNRHPGMVDAEKITTEWDEIPAEQLPEKFASTRPVCWSCHMTEKFIREHPDLVVMRPWKKGGPLGEYVPEPHSETDVQHVHHN